jgi:mRNA interferase RelE/StbE
MIHYENVVKKAVTKGLLPKERFARFNNVFIALETTADMGLFDIKKLKSSDKRTYYRLRKGKYRAIFYTELYENVVDLNFIANYEKKEKNKKVIFTTAADILKS